KHYDLNPVNRASGLPGAAPLSSAHYVQRFCNGMCLPFRFHDYTEYYPWKNPCVSIWLFLQFSLWSCWPHVPIRSVHIFICLTRVGRAFSSPDIIFATVLPFRHYSCSPLPLICLSTA